MIHWVAEALPQTLDSLLVIVIFEKKEMVEQAVLTGFGEPYVVILCQVAAYFCRS